MAGTNELRAVPSGIDGIEFGHPAPCYWRPPMKSPSPCFLPPDGSDPDDRVAMNDKTADEIRPFASTTGINDRYRVERELGRGGMATVYLAEDLRHRRKVALKVLHPELSAVIGHERFLKEIEVTASLQHPHILPLFDSGNAGGQLFYVMPFVEGETLRSRLERETQLPIADVVQIATEVGDALAYAHERGVIHRDIKPENILLHGGHAVVADFGIALAVQEAGGQRMTQTGLSLGTPQYMAPEQAMGEKAIDARADIYALGAVCYEMLIGEPPFTGPTPQAIVARVLTATPASLTTSRSTISPSIDRAVLKALQKLPADRFDNAKAFTAALASDASATPTPNVLPAPRSAQSSRAIGMLAAILVVVAAVAAWGWLRGGTPSDAASNGRAAFMSIALDDVSLVGHGNYNFAVSPDGRQIALVGRQGIGVRSLDSLGIRRYEATSKATNLFWSPDSRTIGFNDADSLRLLDVASGIVRAVCALRAIRGSAWGPDGTILVGTASDGLFRATAAGRTCTRFIAATGASPPLSYLRPYFFGDGRHFLLSGPGRTWVGSLDRDSLALLADVGRQTMERVLVAPDLLLQGDGLDGTVLAQRVDPERARVLGDPVRVLENVPNDAGRPGLSASNAGVLVVSDVDPTARGHVIRRDLRSIARGGGDVRHQPWGIDNFQSIRLSHDGKRLAMGGWNIVVRSGSHDERVGGSAEAQRDISRTPLWMPGDTAIVYYRYFGTPGRIDIVQLASGVTRTLIASDSNIVGNLFDLSADGRRIAYRFSQPLAEGPAQVWEFDIEHGSRRRMTELPTKVFDLRYAPTGGWIAYESGEGARHEIILQPYPGQAAPIRVATDGRAPRWREDGRELYYLGPDESVMAVSVGSGAVGAPTVAVPGSAVIPDHVATYEAMPDGQRFLFDIRSPVRSLTFIQNWTALIGSKRQ